MASKIMERVYLDGFLKNVDLVVALVEHSDFSQGLAQGRFEGKTLLRF